MDSENQTKQNELFSSIENTGSTEVKSSSGTFYCLSIIGQIEGHYVLDQNQKSTKSGYARALCVCFRLFIPFSAFFVFLHFCGLRQRNVCHSLSGLRFVFTPSLYCTASRLSIAASAFLRFFVDLRLSDLRIC